LNYKKDFRDNQGYIARLFVFLLTLYNKFKLMRKIEHIGIAVKSLETSNLLFEKLFGQPPYKQEEVVSEGVKTSFFMNGPNKIELLEATNPDSPIAKFIDKKGEGIHHIAFDVYDIEEEMMRLKNEGFIVLNEVLKKGADNKLVAFLHPKGTNGVLIELCQEIK
jgi:methylmalonyl-CoA/ethylmalonyl-CoA epimerase